MKENQRIEWKETWRDEFLRWICAFANAEGGRLHVGRNDIGVGVGVPGMIEAWGRGIERIMEACRIAKTPVPKLRYEPSGLWVEFALPPGGVARLGEKLGEKLDENRAAIIRALSANPKVTIVELARQLGLSTTAVENNLRYLKTQKLIVRIGAPKGGVWQVKDAMP